MNRILLERECFDGSVLSKKSLESWYDTNNKLSDAIKQKIQKVHRRGKKKIESLLREIEDNIHKILLSSPEELEIWTIRIDKDYPDIFSHKKKGKETSTKLGKELLDAFHYDYYRKNKLVELAKKLNIKTCPYCNMHYTLFAEEGENKTDSLAKFQFDHFYDKCKYPMLSMSLYNLIPSCAVCNQGKSTRKLSLSFHPYYSDICKQFRFELHDPIGSFCGEKIHNSINDDLNSKTHNKSELDDFAKTFHLKSLYQRHGDIAQEVFDKAYEYPYYSNPNKFKWLKNGSPEYIKRLWMGTYTDENEIEKRPMTKFIQDLWEQALSIKVSPEDILEL